MSKNRRKSSFRSFAKSHGKIQTFSKLHMAEIPDPIKRSMQLAPLSREHHEGLLAAWKIRQGLAKNIEPQRIIAFVNWFWQQHLQQHFQKEETALMPVLSTSHPLMQQMVQEHRNIERQVQVLNGHGELKNLGLLAQLLTDHIRFEERQLFGEIEKAATSQQLQTVAELLHDESTGAVWDDEFWTKSR